MPRRLPHRLVATGLALGALAFPAAADVLGTTDPTIRNNLCVGFECSNNEFFPLIGNMIKIKSQDTRLRFEDVSTNVSFATTDWQLTANEPAQFGQDRFILEDLTATTQPFSVDGGTPSHALYVDTTGHIGLGTSVPLEELHIVGDTEALFLMEAPTAPGGPQQYALLVDQAGFGIFDYANDLFPFSIAPGAVGDALNLQASQAIFNLASDDYNFRINSDTGVAFFSDAGLNRIGMGTVTPAAPLHVARASTGTAADFTAGLLVEDTGTNAPRGLLTLRNNGNVFFGLENTSITAGDNSGRAWNFQNNGGEFRVTTAPGGGSDIEMRLTTAGDMIIEGNYFASSGTELNVPDYVFDADYDLKPLSEVAAFIDTHSHLPGVPSAAQINANGLNMTDMQMRLLKKVEELTLYTLEQESELAEVRALRARVAAQEAALSALGDQLRALQAQMP